MEFVYFDGVRTGNNGTGCAHQAYVTCLGQGTDHLNGWSEDTQHSEIRIKRGQIDLLNGTQGFGRSGVTG